MAHAAIFVPQLTLNREFAVNAAAPQGDSGTEAPRGVRISVPRIARLLRHADFERVYKQGRRHFSASMTVFYLRRVEGQPSDLLAMAKKKRAPRRDMTGLRIGFTVSRALGGAVQRNRMRRRLREAVRLSRPSTDLPVDIVINPKKSLLATDFIAVLNEVARAFLVIEQKLETKAGPEFSAPQTRGPKAHKPKPEARTSDA